MEAYLIAQATEAADYSCGAIQAVIVPLLAALLGAYVGGWMAGRAAKGAVKEDYKLRAEREEKQAREELRAYYQSIHTEMKCFWEQYKHTYWAAIKKVKTNDYLRVDVPERQLFTVYKTTACMLGKVPNSNLRKQILEVYDTCEAVYVSLVAYSEDLRDFLREVHVADRAGQDVETPSFKARHKYLVESTAGIDQDSSRLDKLVKDLLAALEREIESLT